MLDVEVKMSLPIYKPQSEGGESSDKTIDSPRCGSEAISEEQTTESEPQEESSLATTTDEVLEEDQAATETKQLSAEDTGGSDDGPEIKNEGSPQNHNCTSANADPTTETSSDPHTGTASKSEVDSTAATSYFAPANEYPAEVSHVANPSVPYASGTTHREEAQASVDSAPAAVGPRLAPPESLPLPPESRPLPPESRPLPPAVGAYDPGPQDPTLTHHVAPPRADGAPLADQGAPHVAPPTTEPFSWYQAPYNYNQYPQYQHYPQPTNQQYSSHYQDYPGYSQYSQYSQYPQYQQYPPYSQHHSQDPYWSSNGHVQSSHHHKSEHLSYQKIDELHGSLMRLKDEAMAHRETHARLERLEHKVEFIMDYLKHKLIQNDTQEKNSREEVNSHLKQRLVKMQEAISSIEHRFSAHHSSDEEIEIKNVNSSETKMHKK